MHLIILLILIPYLLLETHQTSKIEFNSQKAIDFWYYECASYCSQNQLLQWNASTVSEKYPNIRDITVIYNPNGQNQAYSAYDADKNLIFLAFRGTTNIQNWGQDLYMTKSDIDLCEGCQIHTGFLVAYNGIKSESEESIVNLKKKYPQAEVAIIGHSMGAAFATMAFARLYDILKPDYFYTFGLPRMGNQQFANFIDNNFNDIIKARITHNKDIIPRVPLASMGFTHFKTEIFYSENTEDFTICEEDEDIRCINQFSIVNFSIEDHRIMFGLNVHEYKYTCQ